MNKKESKYPAILCEILKIAPITGARIATREVSFPKMRKIGRTNYIRTDELYGWLSAKAGKKVTPDDVILSGSDVQKYYGRSNTWVWQQVKNGNLVKPFKINRTNYWFERDIVGESEAVA